VPGLLKTILSHGSPQGGQTYVVAKDFNGSFAAVPIVEPMLRQPAAIVAPAPALMNVLRVTISRFDFVLTCIRLLRCLKSSDLDSRLEMIVLMKRSGVYEGEDHANMTKIRHNQP
jgi:hypothetical protein